MSPARTGRARSARRWLAVAVLVAVLGALPWVVSRWPSPAQRRDPAALLARVQASAQVGYTGYAEAFGGIRLPLTDRFTELTNLLGDRTSLRVWWADDRNYRIDTVTADG